MKRLPLLLALIGAAVLLDHRPAARHGSGGAGFAEMRNRMMKRMLASMPEDSPPKLIMSILPELQAQNERILALLEEQNALLRRLTAKQA